MLRREKEGGVSDEVWRYDVFNDIWERMNDFPGSARSYAAAVSSNSGALIVGGQDENLNLISETYYYNASEDVWKALPDFPIEFRGAELLEYKNDFIALGGLTHRYTRIDSVRRISVSDISFLPENIPFEVYPNPANDRLVIQSNSSEPLISLRIFNMKGEIVMEKDYFNSSHSSILDITSVKVGFYILSLTGEKQSQKTKLVVIKKT